VEFGEFFVMDNHQFCSAFFFSFFAGKFCGVAQCGGYPKEKI
jgi:hypothetical protein